MKRITMGRCFLCGEEITSNQHIAWRRLAGAAEPTRVHRNCLTEKNNG